MLTWAGPPESTRQFFEDGRNLLENPGMEAGKATYTITGGASAVETSAPLIGKQSLKWDASATTQYFSSTQYTVPAGLKGRDCEIGVLYLWSSGTATHLALQAYDGTNVLAEADFAVTSGSISEPMSIIFTCPTSGTIGFRVKSTADAAEITLDEAWVGSVRKYKDVSQAELVAHAYYADTVNCQWSRTNASLGAFTADTDCPAITVVSSNYTVTTTDNDLPDIDFAYLPPGTYIVTATGTVEWNTSASTGGSLAINDGSAFRGNLSGRNGNQTTPDLSTFTLKAVYSYTTGGARNFRLAGAASSSATIRVYNDATGSEGRVLTWTVERLPLGSEKAITLDNADWYVDANIGGATVALDTGAQSSYVALNNGSLDMVLNSGSQTAQIPCNGAVSTGLTCSGVNEIVGVTIPSIPKAGAYQACFEFGHYLSCSTGSGQRNMDAAFEIIETLDNSSAVISEGNSRVPIVQRHQQSSTENIIIGRAFNICGIFKWDTVGKKVLKLAYEKTTNTNIIDNFIYANRAAGLGQIDIHVTVRPWSQQASTFIANTVTSPVEAGTKIASAFVVVSGGTPSVSNQTGSWISSITDNGVGDFTLNLVANTFSVAPHCTCSARIGGRACALGGAGTTVSTVPINVWTGGTGAPEDQSFHVICHGEK